MNKLNGFQNIDVNNSSKILSWKDRPQVVVDRIDSIFQKLSEDRSSQWGLFNGKTIYYTLSIHDHFLVKKMIKDSYPKQKEWNIVEIGAGNFQFEDELCHFINEQKDLPDDIKVNIIGVRGEGRDSTENVVGKCKVYKLTAFKVENLFTEFKKRGLELDNKVDLVTSSWCFRHLVDPLGTYQQTYDMLRPKTGLLIMDGFFYLDTNETMDKVDARANMIHVLVNTKAPFLLQKEESCRQIWSFLINRPNEEPLKFPITYEGTIVDLQDRYQCGSNTVTKFETNGQKYGRNYLNGAKTFTLDFFGDKGLYNGLRKNGLIDMDKGCIETVSQPVSLLDIHKAVLRGDIQAIEEALIHGSDIDESDENGYTPLHLAVKENKVDCVKYLLNKGAEPNIPSLFDVKLGLEIVMPLKTATLINPNPEIIALLKQAGASEE